MTYEQHVREVAFELAGNYWNQNKSNPALRFEQLGSDIQNIQVDKMLSTARIAVRLQAEIITEWMDAYAWTLEGKSKYLLERGLIPAPEPDPFYCVGGQLTGNGNCTNQCEICSKKQRNGHDTANQ